MAIFFAATALTLAFSPLLNLEAAIMLALALLLLGLSAALIGQLIDRSIELPAPLFGKYLAPLVIAACLLSRQFIDDSLAIVPTIAKNSPLELVALLSRTLARVCAVTSVIVMILMSCVLIFELPARWLAGLTTGAYALPLSATRILIVCAVFFLAASTITQLLSIELNPIKLLTPP